MSNLKREDYLGKYGEGPLPAERYEVEVLKERVAELEARLAALEGGRRGRKPAES